MKCESIDGSYDHMKCESIDGSYGILLISSLRVNLEQ